MKLAALIMASTKAELCFYNFTHFGIASAIVERQKKFPNFARLIVNHNFQREHCEALKYLIDNRVACYAHNPSKSQMGHMHCKAGLFKMENGDDLVWHGSWNCTGHSDANNIELVTVTDERDVVGGFRGLFKEALNSKSTKLIKPKDCFGKTVNGSGFAKDLNKIPKKLWHR